MIEMDLEESVNFIIAQVDTEDAVFSMFSATMIPEVKELAKKYLKEDHAYTQIGDLRAAKKEIEQRCEFVTVSGEAAEPVKKRILARLLKNRRPPIMVFVNQKVDTELLQAYIQGVLKVKCVALHGSKSQERREAALESLRAGRVEVIVATNVAARGIDIDNVQHVINYDAPRSLVDYVHRIGRTGRAGKSGVATTLLTPADEEIFGDLRKYLADNDQTVPKELAQQKQMLF